MQDKKLHDSVSFGPTMKPSQPSRVPGAVVLGGDYQGLGIVRSLGRIGVPVVVLDDERSISRYSRYTTRYLHVEDLRTAEGIVAALLDAGARFDLAGWLLFPTRDEQVAAISRNRSALAEVFRVPLPDWNVVQFAWDKRKTYEFAQRCQVPIPRTWCPISADKLDSLDLPFPLALKPAVKEHFFYATHAKAWRVDSRKDLHEKFQCASHVLDPSEILLQDFIPGDGRHQFSFCAFFKEGRALGSMIARRRRQHPHDFGRASTFVETIDLPVLEGLSQRFLGGIGYYGLVEVEFKLDPRDGQFKLLDVNARTWGYHTLGFSAGVDFALLLYLDQVCGDVEFCRGRPGISWIRLLTDLPTGFLDVISGRLRPRDFVKSLRHFNIEAVFNLEDPLPGLAEVALLPYLTWKRGF